jgi:Flp pilus assembly protein TadG
MSTESKGYAAVAAAAAPPISSGSAGSGRFLQRLGGWVRGLMHDRMGAAAVEFGLALPVLGGIIVPMIDVGMGAYKKMEVQDEAEAGAQYAIANGYSSTAIQSAATNATSLTGVTATPAESCRCGSTGTLGASSGTPPCTGTCADGTTPGTYVSVSTSVSYSTLINYPGITTVYPALTNPMTLTGYSIVRIK